MLPTVRGTIDRRILVNYHADPQVVARLLPPPFRPQTVRGRAIVGICLIRLKRLRPTFAPAWLGISSENAAHRISVEWDDECGPHHGVYIRRRDTNRRFNVLTGGRLFPGIHHHAQFNVSETADTFQIAVASDDGATRLSVRAHLADTFPTTSVFASLDDASQFFAAGALGYSAGRRAARYQGLELRCPRWHVEPLTVDDVQSSLYDDTALFPAGSIQFDCALLMRNIDHTWHGHHDLCCNATRSN